jgi:phosphotransferase system HPr (HPr) family protein
LIVEADFTVRHASGLHARPAALFVKTANKFKANILVRNLTRGGTNQAMAKSILSVLTLGVVSGHCIHVEADGEDAQEAVDAIRELIETNFGEN